MKIISFANLKGGVGKTTSAVNFAGALAISGFKVLLIDLDPQGNASIVFGAKKRFGGNCYSFLKEGKPLCECMQSTYCERLFLMPTDASLAKLEFGDDKSEFLLKNALSAAEKRGDTADFDFIIIDCPPSLGRLLLNGLCASDGVVVPVQCEYYAIEGLVEIVYTLGQVKQFLNPKLQLDGILFTLFDGRNCISEQVAKIIEQKFCGKTFATKIKRNVRLAEAPSHNKTVFDYDDKSEGARGYRGFCAEYLDKYNFKETTYEQRAW